MAWYAMAREPRHDLRSSRHDFWCVGTTPVSLYTCPRKSSLAVHPYGATGSFSSIACTKAHSALLTRKAPNSSCRASWVMPAITVIITRNM